MDSIELTREEAKIQLKYGKVLTHSCFEEDEYVQQQSNGYYLLSGKYEVSPLMFWTDRRSSAFDTGWTIYTGKINTI